MKDKETKVMCNQCKKCAVENTAILGCADDNCKCHTVVSNKLPNKEECQNCKGHPDGDYGECGDCHRMITQFPTPLSPSDKTWEERFDELMKYTPLFAYKDELFKSTDIYNDIREKISDFIQSELTSATIKAKEGVLREIYDKCDWIVIDTGGDSCYGIEASEIKEYAKSQNIKLEEPNTNLTKE